MNKSLWPNKVLYFVDGVTFKKAVLATAHKLLRVIYTMLTQRTSFSYEANS